MGWQWCELPSDLLYEIDAELAYIEKVRARATCVSWNSVLPRMPNHKLPQLPWLLQTNVDNQGRKSHGLFNICDNKLYQLDLPQLQGKLLKGSSHGWLVAVSVDQKGTTPSSPDICLINPLTGVQIQLPPRSTFPDVVNYYPDRVGEEYSLITNCTAGVADFDSNHVHLNLTYQVVTFSSCIENCVAVAIYGELGELAWCMPSHKKWTPLNIYLDSSIRCTPIDDAIFSNNKLYVVNCYGCLFQVENMGGLNPKVTEIIAQELPPAKCVDHMYVVECSDGRLMMVIASLRHLVEKFEAYEVDLPNSCWRLVNNIGNEMLFLGHNHSFSIPTCEFPGYRGNRIYYSDDPLLFGDREGKEGDAKIGIFNFEDGSVEKLDGFANVRRSLWPQAVWVTPPSYH